MTTKQNRAFALATAVFVAVFVLLFPTVMSSANDNEGVCTGTHLAPPTKTTVSVVITAPEGQLISGYCVKAGSIHQGNGPEYYVVDPPAKSVTISHTSGKDISHYTVTYVSAPGPTTTTVDDTTTTTVDGTTTTTVEQTTTTVSETTTTIEPTTTETTQPSSTTVETVPTTEIPTTSVAPTTVERQPVAAGVRVASLPATGSNTWNMVLLGAGLVALGVIVVVAANRRTR